MKPILYHFERVKDLFGIYRSSCNTTMNKQLGRHAPSNSQKIKFFEGLVPFKMNVHNPRKKFKSWKAFRIFQLIQPKCGGVGQKGVI